MSKKIFIFLIFLISLLFFGFIFRFFEGEKVQASPATISFSSKFVIDSAINGPRDVHSTDLDGDGDQDVLGAATDGDYIVWYRNDGGGTFTKFIIDGAFNCAHDVYSVDLDNDGDQDVLGAACIDDDIAWYRNDGGGTFTKFIIDGAFDGAYGVHSADLDGDGDQDVLGGAGAGNEIAWWENDGAGNFTKHIIDSAVGNAMDVHSADLDGDGDQDVLGAAFAADDIAWYRNDGGGTFTKFIIDGYFDQAYDVESADLDGDGDQDVLGAAIKWNGIAWYRNDGGDPLTFTKFIMDAAFPATDVHIADLDGDGDQDVLGAEYGNPGKVAWWENDGTGNFGPMNVIDSTLEFPFDVYSADLDGDGDQDILGAISAGDEIVWWKNIKSANVSGWAWADASHIGWISFNCNNPELPEPRCTYSYGVNIDPDTGVISGHAWSRGTDDDIGGVGWISFNRAETFTPPKDPDFGTHLAEVRSVEPSICDIDGNDYLDEACGGNDDPTITTDTPTTLVEKYRQVFGWARVLSACENNYWDGTKCTSDLAGDAAGGWDGWIKFSRDPSVDGGANYGVTINRKTGEFSGWAWTGWLEGTDPMGVVGWISFNNTNPGAGGAHDYEVVVDPAVLPNDPPTAIMDCEISQCDPSGSCDGIWQMYQPTNSYPTERCTFTITNESTDPDGQGDIVRSEWDIYNWGTDPDWVYVQPNALASITLQNMSPGPYTIELYVEDSVGASDITTHDFTMLREIKAGFLCSLDGQNWQDCEQISLAEDQIIYVKDNQAPWGEENEKGKDYSLSSEGASLKINSYIWQKGDGTNFQTFATATTTATTTLTQDTRFIRLIIEDTAPRTDYTDRSVSEVTVPLPEWKEIPPLFWIRKFFASLNGFLDSLNEILTNNLLLSFRNIF